MAYIPSGQDWIALKDLWHAIGALAFLSGMGLEEAATQIIAEAEAAGLKVHDTAIQITEIPTDILEQIRRLGGL